MRSLALPWLAGSLLVGCTRYDLAVREPPHVAPAATQASVCVLRPHLVALLAQAVVRDNGRLVGATRGPSRFCYLIEPGTHEIVSSYGDDLDVRIGMDRHALVTLHAAPGGSYFLHHDVRKLLTLDVAWVSADEAARMAEETDYVELVAAPDGETLPQPGEVVAAAR